MKEKKYYKELISAAQAFLELRSFRSAGESFYIKNFGNVGIINFQKSRRPSPREIDFTVNLGIVSTKVLHTLDVKVTDTPPPERSHWKQRVGFLLPRNVDYWWKINSQTDFEKLRSEIIDVLERYCIPHLKAYMPDEMLVQKWLSGASPGITNLQRLIYLTSLMKCDEHKLLKSVLMELRLSSVGKAFEETAEDHIARLGVQP